MSQDDSVNIPVKLDAAKAVAELKGLAKDFEKVRKSAEDFERAFKEASEQDEKRLQAVRKGWAEIAVSVYASARAVEGFVNAMAEQEQQQSALDSLGNAYSEVSRQTAGTVSAVQALHVQNTLLQGNIPVTTRELGVITRAAREFARATRTDATSAIEQLTEALKKGEQEGLARFGLTADATKGKLENYIAGVRELERRQQSTSVSTRTLTEDTQLLGSHMNMFAGRVATAIAGPLSGLLDWYIRASNLSGTFRDRVMEVARALSGIDEETDAQRQRREENNQRMALRERITHNYAATHGGQRIPLETSGRTLEQLQELDRATGDGGGGLINRRNADRTRSMLENAPGGSGGNSVIAAALRRASGIRGVTVEEIGRDQDSDNAARARAAREAEQATQNAARARMTRERHSSGSSHRDTTVPTAIRKYQAEVIEAGVIGAPVSPVGNPSHGENAADFWNTRAEWQEAVNTSFRDHRTELSRVAHADAESRISNTRGKGEAAFAFARESTRLAGERTQRRATRDSATRRGANLESLGGRVSQGMGFDLDGEGNIAAFNAIKSGSELAIGSLQQLSQGFSGLFDAMTGGKSASEAFQMFISDTLSGLGKMAFNKGLFYTFEGLAAMFTNPVAAPFLLASGVGLMALGGVLGYAGSATKPTVQETPGANSARQVGSARNASGKTPGANNSDMMQTTINFSSLTPPTPRDYQSVVYANRQANRYGLNSDVRKAPRV